MSSFANPFWWAYLRGGGEGGVYVRINECHEEKMKKSLIFFIKTLFTSNVLTQAYSEPCQTPKMETFVKIVDSLKPLIAFAINSILDVWQDSEYASVLQAQTDFTFNMLKVNNKGIRMTSMTGF